MRLVRVIEQSTQTRLEEGISSIFGVKQETNIELLRLATQSNLRCDRLLIHSA
jgi:hypothetical protein